MRAEIKVRRYPPAALRADRFGGGPERLRSRPTGLIEYPAAPLALQETLPPFDRNERNKEETQVVVQPFEPGRGQAAARADPRLIIYLHFFWLYPADEEESDHLRIRICHLRLENHVTTNSTPNAKELIGRLRET